MVVSPVRGDSKWPSFLGEGKVHKVLLFASTPIDSCHTRSTFALYGVQNVESLNSGNRSEEYGEAEDVVERKKQRKSCSFLLGSFTVE
jgi:hypothetical protein